MFVALWEYEVKPGCEKRFEKAYGPDGDWAKLFQSDSHYREMRLVRDAFHSGVYLTMDFWESRAAYEKFMAEHRREYEALDARGEKMTAKERRIGLFEVVKA
jgi:heme-degrading monooxygenase HmoA